MGKRRDCLKTLRRRKDFLEQKLQLTHNLDNVDYPGKQYDKAELSALYYVLKELEGNRK